MRDPLFELYSSFCVKIIDLEAKVLDFVKQDIRRLVYMLKPIRDIDSGRKLYRKVEICDDHDGGIQYCMFCEDSEPTVTVCDKKAGKTAVFCEKCGYELVAYDMESE